MAYKWYNDLLALFGLMFAFFTMAKNVRPGMDALPYACLQIFAAWFVGLLVVDSDTGAHSSPFGPFSLPTHLSSQQYWFIGTILLEVVCWLVAHLAPHKKKQLLPVQRQYLVAAVLFGNITRTLVYNWTFLSRYFDFQPIPLEARLVFMALSLIPFCSPLTFVLFYCVYSFADAAPYKYAPHDGLETFAVRLLKRLRLMVASTGEMVVFRDKNQQDRQGFLVARDFSGLDYYRILPDNPLGPSAIVHYCDIAFMNASQ